jgi:hypothetical protein
METDNLFLNCHRFSVLSFVDLLRIFHKENGNMAGMKSVQTMSICTGIAKNLAFQNRYARRPTSFERTIISDGMPSLKRVICVSHGKTSLRNASILPSNLDVFPTVLDINEIEVLEILSGVKLEFGVTGTEDSDVRITNTA